MQAAGGGPATTTKHHTPEAGAHPVSTSQSRDPCPGALGQAQPLMALVAEQFPAFLLRTGCWQGGLRLPRGGDRNATLPHPADKGASWGLSPASARRRAGPGWPLGKPLGHGQAGTHGHTGRRQRSVCGKRGGGEPRNVPQSPGGAPACPHLESCLQGQPPPPQRQTDVKGAQEGQ